jgi:hypothetical protein
VDSVVKEPPGLPENVAKHKPGRLAIEIRRPSTDHKSTKRALLGSERKDRPAPSNCQEADCESITITKEKADRRRKRHFPRRIAQLIWAKDFLAEELVFARSSRSFATEKHCALGMESIKLDRKAVAARKS